MHYFMSFLVMSFLVLQSSWRGRERAGWFAFVSFGYLVTVNVLRLFLTVLWVDLLCVTVFMLNSTTKYIIYHADKKLKYQPLLAH